MSEITHIGSPPTEPDLSFSNPLLSQTNFSSSSSTHQIVDNSSENDLLSSEPPLLSNTDFYNQLNIATHNAQGLTDPLKFQIWLEFCAKNDYHIISITETKLKNSTTASLTNPIYKLYTSNFSPKNQSQREASLGTAIALHKTLQPYIHNIQTYPGTALCIDLYLPSNNKLRLISLYLPSNHPDQSASTQNIITNWLSEARSRNWHTITLGDFNDNATRSKRTTKLFTTLQSLSSSSLLDFFSITEPTWKRGPLQSQIDDIWVNPEILLDFSPPQLIDPTNVTDSDHKIIATTWKTNFNLKLPRSKKKKRKIYHYDQMTNDTWQVFSNAVGKEFETLNISTSPTNYDELNKFWNKWSNTIKMIANREIPTTYKAPRKFHAFSLKSTKLHLALKAIINALRLLKSIQPPNSVAFIIHAINNSLLKAASLTDYAITLGQPQDLTSNYSHFRTNLKNLKNTIWKARSSEIKAAQREQINFYIQRRHNDMETNTTRMIDSILNRKKAHISYDKIIAPDKIITDPKEIKQVTREHFNNWTKHNPSNPNFEQEWIPFLQPLTNIQPKIYETLTQPITLSELHNAINIAPTKKATGPSGIANEMIKHLPNIAKTSLLQIFNACLSLEKTPKNWGLANIWAIPKKQHYNNDLNYTRPITLIEHTRKIFRKILTLRLNQIFTHHSILSKCNNVALPYTSTLQPIQTVAHIIEHSNITNNQYWLLAQDMSKAYDMIHILLLIKTLQRPHILSKFINLLNHLLNSRKQYRHNRYRPNQTLYCSGWYRSRRDFLTHPLENLLRPIN